MRRALRELFDELVRVADQAGKMIRQVADDAAKWGGPLGGSGSASVPDASAFAAIRELGKLRDEGLITEDEFQVKKAQLLEQL